MLSGSDHDVSRLDDIKYTYTGMKQSNRILQICFENRVKESKSETTWGNYVRFIAMSFRTSQILRIGLLVQVC